MCEPRRRIGVVRSSVANEAIEVDSLVIDYLKCWERSWSSKCTYSEDELRSIRCSLFGAVMRRYVRSGEMSFTRSELKQAIRSAKEIIKPVKTKQISKTVDPICYGFVSLFFSDWHESAQFSQEEQNIIFAHLYKCYGHVFSNDAIHHILDLLDLLGRHFFIVRKIKPHALTGDVAPSLHHMITQNITEGFVH